MLWLIKLHAAALPLLPGFGSASLALHRSSLKRRGVRTAGFDDLPQCEVAYDRLLSQCSSQSALPRYRESRGRSSDLVYDEDGNNAINRDGGRRLDRTPYKPPDNWDYKFHGDDWDKLGECGGPNQSPVDLSKYMDTQGQTKYLLWFDYYVDPHLRAGREAELVNDGHGLRYDVRENGVDMGFVKVGKQEKPVSQYTFHAPSEHSLDGAIFPLELQVYHEAEGQRGIVAVAVFFREGPSNPFLKALLKSMHGAAPVWSSAKGEASGPISRRLPNAFNLESIIPRGDPARERSFYNYQGSLTQPPCTEGVDWWVLSTPITATREEIRFIRRALFGSSSMRHGNARSTMPLGNRTVFAAIAGFQHAIKTHVMPALSRHNHVGAPRGYSSGDVPWGQHWQTKEATESS